MALVELIGAVGFIHGNISATIDEQLHAGADELGKVLKEFVQERTPVRRGALIKDISYEAYPDPGGAGSDIVWIYSGTSEQEAAWHRIYVQYQEGEPLGQHTYTNEPRQMFLGTAEGDGLTYTEMWAEERVQIALDMCVGGAGVPF